MNIICLYYEVGELHEVASLNLKVNISLNISTSRNSVGQSREAA